MQSQSSSKSVGAAPPTAPTLTKTLCTHTNENPGSFNDYVNKDSWVDGQSIAYAYNVNDLFYLLRLFNRVRKGPDFVYIVVEWPLT